MHRTTQQQDPIKLTACVWDVPWVTMPLLARTRRGTRGSEACSQAVGTHMSLVSAHLSVSWLREASRTIRHMRMMRASVGRRT